MRTRIVGWAIAMVVGTASAAGAGPVSLIDMFNLSFAASQSLWQGGPTAGLDEDGRTSGSVGLYYDVKANTGTVNATQLGQLAAHYQSEVGFGTPISIGLEFDGTAGSVVESLFGASAEAGVFIDVSGCIGVNTPFGCGGISYDIDTDIAIIDEGFFLSPTTTHTPVIDQQRSAVEADQAFGVGAGPSLGPYSLGPSMNLDLEQRIFFTPTGVMGMACYQNQTTLESGCMPFAVPTSGIATLDLMLGVGTWDITFINISLANIFRNDIDLELRPAFDYGIGSWPPPGQELFAFGLLDETFSLNFSQVLSAGSITVEVLATPAEVPEPASLALLGTGLVAIAWRLRRRRRT